MVVFILQSTLNWAQSLLWSDHSYFFVIYVWVVKLWNFDASDRQSSVSWADDNCLMSWSKWNEVIDWGQEEKPEFRSRRAWESWSANMPGVLLKGQELWVGYQLMQEWLKRFSLAAKVPDLTKPLLSLLLLSGMSMWTEIHGLMAGRRPLNVLESWRASQMWWIHCLRPLNEHWGESNDIHAVRSYKLVSKPKGREKNVK